jgi:hypothetical protein
MREVCSSLSRTGQFRLSWTLVAVAVVSVSAAKSVLTCRTWQMGHGEMGADGRGI